MKLTFQEFTKRKSGSNESSIQSLVLVLNDPEE